MTLWSITERFIQERTILNNVSPATISWYRYSLKAFQPVLEAEFESMPALKAAVIQRIGELQKLGRGNKAVSVNTYLRCLKAFMKWAKEEQIVKELFKLSWLKETKFSQRCRQCKSRRSYTGSPSSVRTVGFIDLPLPPSILGSVWQSCSASSAWMWTSKTLRFGL